MVVLIFSFVIGVTAIWIGFKMTKTYFQVKGWARVDASVLSKKVDYNYAANGNHYSLKVEYKYVFNSKEYVNDKVFVGELLGGTVTYRLKWQPDKEIENLGDTVKIYVDPDMPSQSVIFCNGVVWYIFALVVGFILLVYCLFTLIGML